MVCDVCVVREGGGGGEKGDEENDHDFNSNKLR